MRLQIIFPLSLAHPVALVGEFQPLTPTLKLLVMSRLKENFNEVLIHVTYLIDSRLADATKVAATKKAVSIILGWVLQKCHSSEFS